MPEAVVQRGGAAWQLLYLLGFDQGCSGVDVTMEGSRGPEVLQVQLPHAPPKEKGRTASVVGLPHGTSSTAAYVLSRSGRTQLLQSNFADQLINIDDSESNFNDRTTQTALDPLAGSRFVPDIDDHWHVNLADAHRPDLVKLL